MVLTEDEEDEVTSRGNAYQDNEESSTQQPMVDLSKGSQQQRHRALSRISSLARGVGVSNSRKSLLNRSALDVS